MSCVEIYSFDKAGLAHLVGTVNNSFRGAFAVWAGLEKRYLSPHIPSYVKGANWYADGMTYEQVCKRIHYEPSRVTDICNSKAMREIWDLFYSKEVSLIDCICLGTTFDYVLVRRENIGKVIDAFLHFESNTSLLEQAEILQKILLNQDCVAVGWYNSNSAGNSWETSGFEKDGKNTPYNCTTQKDHWWLFDEISR